MGVGGGGLEGLTSSSQGGAGGSPFVGLGTWRYRTEISAPPASGQVRFNNADPSLATEMFLHETNRAGTDVANFLNLIVADDFIYLQDKEDASNFFIISVASNTDNGVYRTFGITDISVEGVEPSQNTDMGLLVA